MSRVIAISNHKGGVGKTSLSVNLSSGIVREGKKVLVIDCDPQGNATYWFGIKNRQQLKKQIYTLMGKLVPSDNPYGEEEELTREELLKEFDDTVLSTSDGVDVIPANLRFSLMERVLIQCPYNTSEVFKKLVDAVRDRYDYIFVDCPPSFSTVLINILSGVDSVLIPVLAEPLSEEGLTDLIQTIRTTRKNQNPHLEIDGIVIARSKPERTNVARQTRAEINEEYGGKLAVFDTVIYENVKLGECPKSGTSIFQFSPRSAASKAYRDLAKEVIEYAEET